MERDEDPCAARVSGQEEHLSDLGTEAPCLLRYGSRSRARARTYTDGSVYVHPTPRLTDKTNNFRTAAPSCSPSLPLRLSRQDRYASRRDIASLLRAKLQRSAIIKGSIGDQEFDQARFERVRSQVRSFCALLSQSRHTPCPRTRSRVDSHR